MSKGAGTGLARVTIAAPRRRIDVALPEQVPSAELLPSLLRHAGDGLADVGQGHGGWVLRRSDGSLVDPERSLAAQELRDGEVLHLVPRQDEWPEMDYADVVDAIATGARKQTRSWGAAATRLGGITAGTVLLLVTFVLVFSSGPNWFGPGLVALGLAALLLLVAVALARALTDAGAGAVVGTVAMVFGLAGGVAVFNGDSPLTSAQSPQYFAGSCVLLVIALLGYVGVADRTHYFVAGIVVALLGILGSLYGLADAGIGGTAENIGSVEIAAVLATIVIAFAPIIPLLSIRLGKLPMPALPATAEDLLADPPRVPRPRVYASVRRSDELLTGMLLGSAIVLAGAEIFLVLGGQTSAVILVFLVALATLLRARLFPTRRHRVPLLGAGMVGVAALALGTIGMSEGFRLAVMVPALMVLAGLVLAAGLLYQEKPPGPYLGRIADIFDVLLVLAVVPVMCVVVGLFGYIRGLYG